MLQKILEALEPADVNQQALLQPKQRSVRMRVSDAFYHIFQKWL